MDTHLPWFARLCAGALLFAAVFSSPHPAGAQSRNRARVALSVPLPRLDGEHLKATLVEVSYGPGESSAAHSHPCAVIAHVVEGEIRSQVQGEAEKVYKAGETFYEPPNGVHAVSANASTSRPAKLAAFFVCDRETPLTVGVPGPAGKGKN